MTTRDSEMKIPAKRRELEQNRNLFGRFGSAYLAARMQARRLLKSVGSLSITERIWLYLLIRFIGRTFLTNLAIVSI